MRPISHPRLAPDPYMYVRPEASPPFHVKAWAYTRAILLCGWLAFNTITLIRAIELWGVPFLG